MKKCAWLDNVFWGPFKSFKNYFINIFKYLACHADEGLNDRMSLRNLYNSGDIDEEKYHHFLNQCRDDSYDPEEIETPM